MPLSSEHIPLPGSIKHCLEQRFQPQPVPLKGEILSRQELLGCLAELSNEPASLLDAVQRTAAQQNPSKTLAPEQYSILAWVEASFDHWQANFPVEEPLLGHLGRLRALAAALALEDALFFTPGAHPLHTLLDNLQQGAVGWQARLGDAGKILEWRFARTVESSLQWFTRHNTDFARIASDVSSANQRERSRAGRLVAHLLQGALTERELAEARQVAASAINERLCRQQLPAFIGEFLTGEWWESAAIVIQRFGAGSDEWRDMQRAMVLLIDSLRPLDEETGVIRGQLEESSSLLRTELRRWLLSLNDDADELENVIGLIEYTHLRLINGQSLELSDATPIPLAEPSEVVEEPQSEWKNGDWFLFYEISGDLRAQLVLQREQTGKLVFVNFSGVQVMELPPERFQERLDAGLIKPLADTTTFSLSLAIAAGIDSEETLLDLVKQGLPPSDAPEARQTSPVPAPAPDALRSEPSAAAALDEDLSVDVPLTAPLPEASVPRFEDHPSLAEQETAETAEDIGTETIEFGEAAEADDTLPGSTTDALPTEQWQEAFSGTGTVDALEDKPLARELDCGSDSGRQTVPTESPEWAAEGTVAEAEHEVDPLAEPENAELDSGLTVTMGREALEAREQAEVCPEQEETGCAPEQNAFCEPIEPADLSETSEALDHYAVTAADPEVEHTAEQSGEGVVSDSTTAPRSEARETVSDGRFAQEYEPASEPVDLDLAFDVGALDDLSENGEPGDEKAAGEEADTAEESTCEIGAIDSRIVEAQPAIEPESEPVPDRKDSATDTPATRLEATAELPAPVHDPSQKIDNQTPDSEAPVDEQQRAVSVEEAPPEETPVEEASIEKASVEEAPVEKASVEETRVGGDADSTGNLPEPASTEAEVEPEPQPEPEPEPAIDLANLEIEIIPDVTPNRESPRKLLNPSDLELEIIPDATHERKPQPRSWDRKLPELEIIPEYKADQNDQPKFTAPKKLRWEIIKDEKAGGKTRPDIPGPKEKKPPGS